MRNHYYQGMVALVCALGTWGCSNVLGLDKDYKLGELDAGMPPTDAKDDGQCTLGPIPALCTVANGGLMHPAPGGFCIDNTEVTWEAYESWLKSSPNVNDQDSFCKWNTDFTPAGSPPPAAPNGGKQNPVTNVDWCDAYAFCKGMGKRLCGAVGGGSLEVPTDESPLTDACKDQWYSVCSAGGKTKFTYADSPVAGHCQYAEEQTTVPVKSKPKCQSIQGNYLDVFDMNGNVWEWQDACVGYVDGPAAAEQGCFIRGGGFNIAQELEDDSSCLAKWSKKRNTNTLSFVGFRCCWTPQ